MLARGYDSSISRGIRQGYSNTHMPRLNEASAALLSIDENEVRVLQQYCTSDSYDSTHAYGVI